MCLKEDLGVQGKFARQETGESKKPRSLTISRRALVLIEKESYENRNALV